MGQSRDICSLPRVSNSFFSIVNQLIWTVLDSIFKYVLYLWSVDVTDTVYRQNILQRDANFSKKFYQNSQREKAKIRILECEYLPMDGNISIFI